MEEKKNNRPAHLGVSNTGKKTKMDEKSSVVSVCIMYVSNFKMLHTRSEWVTRGGKHAGRRMLGGLAGTAKKTAVATAKDHVSRPACSKPGLSCSLCE